MSNISNKNTKAEILEAYTKQQEEVESIQKQMKEMQEMFKAMQEQKVEVVEEPKVANNPTPRQSKSKVVRVQNYTLGRFRSSKEAKFKLRFQNCMEIKEIPLHLFEEFYYANQSVFDDLKIVILDEDISQQYGQHYTTAEFGVNEGAFDNAIMGSESKMLSYLGALSSYKLQIVFFKYYAKKLKNECEGCTYKKNKAIDEFFKTKYGFPVRVEESADLLVD